MKGNAFRHGRLVGEGENFVDPSPAVERLFLGDIVHGAGNGGAGDERFASFEVSFGAVFDVDRREAVRTVADAMEGSGAFALKESRNDDGRAGPRRGAGAARR